MMELAGYVLEPLRVDSEFALYRGRPPEAAVPILLLAPLHAPKAPSDVLWLEHQVSVAGELDAAWAVRPLQLVHHSGQTMLMLEDPGGESLAGLLDRPLALTRFLQIACNLAAVLGKAHQRGFIHKDIKPSNVLVDAAGDVRLMGFGVAARLPQEYQASAAPEIISGTLAYMAPEQTGRMNRPVDARSDLYSLGVTLYEMLTGTLPFTASDPMEMIHCHLARPPPAPSERASGIPLQVEAIVLKLLAKSPEDRYQTAAGVEADLRRCQRDWEAKGRIEEFPLGEHDAPERLPSLPRLYGREHEVGRLLAAFDRVSAKAESEFVLVSGYAGVGKSSIVNELRRKQAATPGFSAAGKADQFRRDIPYGSLAQAFQGLVRWILGRDEAEVGRWRCALAEALGPGGELMVNLVPELGFVIGEPSPLPDFPPHDALSQFQTAVRRFLGLFARPEHPLVLFLDDLQWLDSATASLVEHLLTHPEMKHLLLVGAYRDNEVDERHPLQRMVAAVRRAGGRVEEIALAPLAPEHVEDLVAAALRARGSQVRPLAELVFAKTGGNPFFAIQFISQLIEEALIVFDAGTASWKWDLRRARAKGFTDNVADLMAARLNRLAPGTKETLGWLACLGNAGDVSTLALIQDASEAAVHSALWPAARAGIVLRDDHTYSFVHDRIREAAYGLVPEDRRPLEHIRIGRLLASRMDPEQPEEGIFDIVNQFDRGGALVTSEEERRRLGAFNLIAGKRAKAASAYQSALQYLSAGRALLGEDGWDRSYRNSFELELNLGECEYLLGDLPAAAERLAALASRADTIEDLAAVTCLRIDLHTTLDRGDQAIEVGLDYLRRIDDQWPLETTAKDVQKEFDRFWARLESRAVETLLDLPLLQDYRLRATMDVLTALVAPAMYNDENLFHLLVARMANLSLEHGNSDGSCFAYVWFGAILGSRFGDYQTGFRFGRLGMDLVDKHGLDRFRPRVHLVFCHHVAPWMQHLKECQPLLRKVFDTAQETGDISYANYSRSILTTHLLAAGERLDEVQREAEQGLAFARRARFGFIIDIITAQLGLIRAFRGLTREFASFDDEEFDEARFERQIEANPQLSNAAFCYWVYKLQLRFHAGDYTAAIAAASKAGPLLWTAPSQFETAEFHFYAALANLAVCDAAQAGKPGAELPAAKAHHAQLDAWAKNCPENFRSRAALVSAEIARIENRELDAMQLYEEAIRSAREHGLLQIEGLANELVARFHTERGFETIADAYLRNARFRYLHWGADGKVRQLDQAHPHLRYEAQPFSFRSMVSTPVEQLDLATVIKVSQAISREIDLKRFIDTLLTIALEHTGADRGLLVTPQGDELGVEAEAKAGQDRIEVYIRKSPIKASELPETVLQYVARSQSSVILPDASNQNQFSEDAYVARNRSRSILCLPLVKQLKLIGVLYLENSQTPYAFTPARMAVLSVLASQAAISLENAYLYAGLKRTQTNLAESQRISRMGSFVWDLATDKIVVSDATRRVLGFPPDEFNSSYAPSMDAVHPDDREHVQKVVGTAAAERKDYDVEFRAAAADGSYKHLHVYGAYVVNELSGAEEYVGTIVDITERKRDEEQMRKLVSLIENSTDFIGYCSASQQVRYLNAGGRRLIGLDLDEDVTRYHIKEFRPPDEYERFNSEILPALSRDGEWVGETKFRHVKTHAVIPVLQTLFFATDKESGQRTGIATIVRDISESKRVDRNLQASLEEKEALLKEVHHRVKNNLQLISSLLNLQANRMADPAVAERFTESRNRIRSMALVHENLYRAGNFARVAMRSHVQNLCAHLVRAYGMHSQRVELVTAIDDVELDLDRAISAGLIINELVSNALKHAFPDNRAGYVEVELKLFDNKHCVLAVKDNGVGLPADFNIEHADTLGLQLVADLTRQLHGAISTRRGKGTSFSIAFNAEGFAGRAR